MYTYMGQWIGADGGREGGGQKADRQINRQCLSVWLRDGRRSIKEEGAWSEGMKREKN